MEKKLNCNNKQFFEQLLNLLMILNIIMLYEIFKIYNNSKKFIKKFFFQIFILKISYLSKKYA